MQVTVVLAFHMLTIGIGLAQAPTGTIAGVVHDPSGAAVTGAQLKVVSLSTGLTRSVASSEQGDYSFPALPAGEYETSAEVPGFQRLVRQTTVAAGVTTTADFELLVGEARESVNVYASTPQIHFDSQTVGGTVTRDQIEDLPLNGRSFMELAKLEPGVQQPARGSFNRIFLAVLGGPGSNNIGAKTRVTVDGGSVMAVGNGGSAMGFSQEVVQEFQISTVNFDLSTGIGDVGAINVVSRSGGNEPHGTAFYFFRDHHLAAYPALNRDAANPDPFFRRRQFGFALGGPVRHDRVFYFANWERNEQRAVFDRTLLVPDFAHFSRITASPLFGNQLSVRLDGRLSERHTAFIRYSHDGNRAFAPSTLFGNIDTAYPSQWTQQRAWADQSLLGITSVLRPTLVNDFRFSYFFINSSERPASQQDCIGCLGIGASTITVSQTSLSIGNSSVSDNLGRRFHWNDVLAWQHTTHRLRIGGEWEHNRTGGKSLSNEPVTLTLYSPQQARQNNIPVPATFANLEDVLQLPLQTATVSVGDPRVRQENGGFARTSDTVRLFFQDTWRLHERLTMNYGLGWTVDHSLNYDLHKPALLAPLLGAGGLGPTRKTWRNFSPVLGLIWSPARDARTAIRAGAGIFYDFLNDPQGADNERTLFGPANTGRQTYAGTYLQNTLAGIPDVPLGASLNFPAPTHFSGTNLMAILPGLRAGLLQHQASADPSIQAFQVIKQGGLTPAEVPSTSALHVNLGFQREVIRDFVVSADFAYRHFIHLPLGVDLNLSNSHHPTIRKCGTAERDDPQAMCLNGAITAYEPAAVATYKGLLVRAEKRFSHGFQFLASWAYSTNTGTNQGLNYHGFQLDNWLQNRGPLNTDYTNILNLGGVAHLPRHIELGLNFAYSSVPPLSAYITGIDFNGDGTTGDLLPGTTANAFNRGMDRADLERLVARFNSTYAFTKDALGITIQPVTLPSHYSLGDNFHSLDLRLSRSFAFHENLHLSLIAEVFNLYNKANLTGFSGDLSNAGFGQPISRYTQVFGSGGPRAFQIGTRVRF
jgi:hypothetical protein